MGLMAGWEIDGVVREGGFTSGIVYGTGEEALVELTRRGLEPITSLVRRSSLEDVFLKLTGRTLVE